MMVMKITVIKMKLLVLVLAAQLLKVNSIEEEDILEKVFEELNKRIQAVKISCQVRKVVFSAALQPPVVTSSGFGIIGPYSNISMLIHSHIITNIGNAYNPNTGVFIAPVKGVYFFTFTTYSWAKNADIGVVLYRNQEEVLRVWEHQGEGDNEDYATNSAALVLQPLDTVSLRLPKGFQVATSIDDNRHTFSGFLLYQL
ncbi:complement C1q tumor necrosis factor-related protein 3-like [Colossoma macropomum]|uniref:complement C1q tumor necrosis factor-related protein 3-like n=1 Tax=Colossoma macropomum TaxID=42526 RepID=UPI001864C910|nr:complement C1q tumor necrosis factor-related protein 3-like [Colossoma macropomum]